MLKYRKIRIFKIAKYRKICIFRHSQNQEMVPDRILLIGNYFRVTSSEIFWGGIRRISAAAGWLCFIF